MTITKREKVLLAILVLTAVLGTGAHAWVDRGGKDGLLELLEERNNGSTIADKTEGDEYSDQASEEGINDFNSYLPPTPLPEQFPFRDAFLNVVSDPRYDSVFEEYREGDDGKFAIIIDKEENQRMKEMHPDHAYYSPFVLWITISDRARWYKGMEDEKEIIARDLKDWTDNEDMGPDSETREMQIAFLKSLTSGTQLIGDTQWNFFDFTDGFDGGFMRYFYIEKDGNVIAFSLTDEQLESDDYKNGNVWKFDVIKQIDF